MEISKPRFLKIGLLAIAVLVFSANTGLKAQYQEYSHNGLTRQYIYYSPSNLKSGAPLVFVLHGYTGDAASMERSSRMNGIADQYGFAVCYPRGTIDYRDNRFWNVGYDFHKKVSIDDVAKLF